MLRFGIVAVLGDGEACVAMLRLLCSGMDGPFWLIRRSERLEKARTDW